jgi:hypothetical protein
MNNWISAIENNVQDRTSVAWKKLCEYVDKVEAEKREEFSPMEALGADLFSQIQTLPESISKLKNVKKVWLYGSRLKRIPPQIGEMESLEYFDPYTSYDLYWFPYEITRCKNLRQSRVSTRVLYGNFKNRMGFPNLKNNPVRYFGNTVHCSVCDKEMSYNDTNQLWITAQVATDILPLLANLCSRECEGKLLKPPEDYIQFPHKGGVDLEQPKTSEREHLSKIGTTLSAIDIERLNQENKQGNKLLKLIRKIWEM